jgi:transposase
MAVQPQDGLRFPGDLTDAEWAVLEPLLPSRRRSPRPAAARRARVRLRPRAVCASQRRRPHPAKHRPVVPDVLPEAPEVVRERGGLDDGRHTPAAARRGAHHAGAAELQEAVRGHGEAQAERVADGRTAGTRSSAQRSAV